MHACPPMHDMSKNNCSISVCACRILSSSPQHRAPSPPSLMASAFQQLARRLGAARHVLIDNVGSPRHVSISGIQKAATLELLQDATASNRFTGEELARISDSIMAVSWAPGHEEELLQAIAQKAVPKRRKQQDF